MKSYREIADKVFERRDKYLVARKQKKKKIIKRVSAGACCLMALLGVGAFHLGWFDSANGKIYTQQSQQYGDYNGKWSSVELNEPTTSPLIPKTTTAKTTTQETTTAQSTTQPETSATTTTAKTTTTTVKTTTTTTERTTTTIPLVHTTVVDNKNAYKYHAYSGLIADWVVEGDVVHILFTNSKYRYMAIDSDTGKILNDASLEVRPEKMEIVGDEVWISYGTQKFIQVYDKSTFTYKRQIKLKNKVYGFNVYGDYLLYADSNQHAMVWHYNMVTGEATEYKALRGNTFYKPEILIDSAKNRVYIGESGSTGSGLYCYDFGTQECKSYNMQKTSIGTEYGVSNKCPQMYLIDNELYWAGFVLDADDVSNILYSYRKNNSSWLGTMYANDDFVVTFSGVNEGFVYDRHTHNLVHVVDKLVSRGAFVVITKSGDLLYTTGTSTDYIILILDWARR